MTTRQADKPTVRSADVTIESLDGPLAPYAETLARNPRASLRPSPDDAAAAVLEELVRSTVPPRGGEDVALLGETLGEGGMALVREATQRSVGRSVAVKTLREGDVSPRSTLRLLHEAWVTGSLEHPNIVPLYDIALDRSGAPLVLLKRVEGVHWGRLLKDPAAFRACFGVADELETHLRILMQVASAVGHAHRRGIVHRDIKPENVMVGEGGEPYLVDWGIAVSLRDDPTGRLPLARDAHGIAGTLCYLAPEMVGVAPERLSERTDVYLLGAVLYEIVCGNPPHLADSALTMLRSALVSQPEIPRSVPDELAAICVRAMSLLPQDRFATAEAFRDALSSFLSHRASEELSRAAEASLLTLERAVEDGAGDDAGRRRVVARAFAECHFGFREAARSWPESARARTGLESAIAAMVRFELSRGDAAAAAAHLAELPSPPDELARQVQLALERAEQEQRGLDELRRLGRDHDPSIGRGARIAAMTILGAVFTFSPGINWLRGVTPSFRGLFTWVTVFLVLSGVVVFVGRRDLLATALNRRLVGSLFVTLCTQVLLHTTAYAFGLTAEASQLMQFCIWMVVSGMLAVFFDSRLWPAVATFAVGWVVTALRYELRPLLSMIGNGVLALNLIWVWKRGERRRQARAG